MAKNPVLPLYYNDILGATIDWTDEEFGAYMRLLIYQWDKGFIPGDERRRAKIADTSNAHWALLSTKFTDNGEGKLINEKMEEVREQKRKHSEKQSDNVRKRYQNATKQDTNEHTKKIPLEIENENEIEIENISVNEYTDRNFLIPQLVAVWKSFEQKRDYVVIPAVDYPALLSIGKMIAAAQRLDFGVLDANRMEGVCNSFRGLVEFALSDELYRDFQLTQIAKYFNAIVSKAKNKSVPGADGKKKTSAIENNITAAQGAHALVEKKYGGKGHV